MKYIIEHLRWVEPASMRKKIIYFNFGCHLGLFETSFGVKYKEQNIQNNLNHTKNK